MARQGIRGRKGGIPTTLLRPRSCDKAYLCEDISSLTRKRHRRRVVLSRLPFRAGIKPMARNFVPSLVLVLLLLLLLLLSVSPTEGFSSTRLAASKSNKLPWSQRSRIRKPHLTSKTTTTRQFPRHQHDYQFRLQALPDVFVSLPHLDYHLYLAELPHHVAATATTTSTAAHSWIGETLASASTSSTITTSNAAVSISNPPSWSSAFPSIPSANTFPPTIDNVLEEEAINSLGRDVLIFLAASVVVVPLSRFLGLTPVLTFLLAGLILGPNGLGTFSNTEADLQLGDIGILFLLFSEGLNLSPDRLRNLGAYYGLGVLQILASMGLFFVGILVGGPVVLEYVAPVIHIDDYVYQIFGSPVQAFCIASAGALSSSAFVLPVLKAKDWEDRPEGIGALSVLLLQDLAVAPLLVLLPLVAGSGPQSSAELGILAAKATVGFGAVLAAGSVLLRYVFDIVAAARSTETFVAAALLVALGMGQAADYLGLSATTGAFAAGVLLAGNRYRAQIKADVRPFEGILLGIFFMTAGASLDPAVVISNFGILVIGIGTFIAIKAGVLFLAGLSLGTTSAGAARVAITLSGGGEFSLVLFKVAQELGVLDAQLNDLLVASVILSMSLTPLLGEVADAVGRYLESNDRRRFSLQGDVITTVEAEELFEQIDADESGTIELEELQVALAERGLSYLTIAEIFHAFDANGDGVISRLEWTKGLEAGLLASAQTVEGMALEAGANIGSNLEIARNAIVICGYTESGKQIYQALKLAGIAQTGQVVAFELNPARVSAGVLSGANVVYGDGASCDLLRAAGVTEPRAVIVAYRSESKRLEATARLRDALPKDTPIYARCVSGQSVGREELIAVGATDVVDERTEAGLRFAALVGALKVGREADQLRSAINAPGESTPVYDLIPGITESLINDLSEEFGCGRRELINLHRIFSSLPNVDGDRFIDVSELGDVLLRNTGGPIDDETLTRWVEFADSEGSGKLSFVDFARVYFGTRKRMASQEPTK